MLAGVCGGLAERLGWPPALVRAIFVAGVLLPVLPGAIAYLLLWWLLPDAPPRVIDVTPVSVTDATPADASRTLE